MTEFALGSIPVLGVALMLVASFLYMWGGRTGKWRRRFIATFIISIAIWGEFLLLGLWDWWLLALYPLIMTSTLLGYGSDITRIKIFKRSYIVLASLVSSILICFLFGGNTWLIIPIEILLGAITVYLGVKNPIPAAVEEFFISFFLWSPKLIYPFAINF